MRGIAGWIGLGEDRDSMAAFLFTWPDGDTTGRPCKLPKVGGAAQAVLDRPESGPFFGPDGLKIPLLPSSPKQVLSPHLLVCSDWHIAEIGPCRRCKLDPTGLNFSICRRFCGGHCLGVCVVDAGTYFSGKCAVVKACIATEQCVRQ